jgi:DNA processing protein
MVSVNEELLYHIALTLVPQVGDKCAKALLDRLGSARKIFQAPRSRLEKIPGVGPARAQAVTAFRDFRRADQECRYMERNRIRALLYGNDDYPYRLTQCADAPPVLFYRGNADLNTQKIISVVGTRRGTDLGRAWVDAYIDAWRDRGLLIISGLAYGIDHDAHRACLRNGIPTIGVLAHGLDKIYPPSHHALAMQMTEQGGLLTEFISGTRPERQNFPKRNRIVAGLSDAVLVVETDVKGGSMITAELASGYDREVFAIPGRIQDEKSHGCNFLIRENRARLTMHPSDLLDFMNWDPVTPRQVAIPVTDLSEDQRLVLGLLRTNGPLQVDELQVRSGLSTGRFSSALLFLEMEKWVVPAPGKQYRLAEPAGGQNLLRK